MFKRDATGIRTYALNSAEGTAYVIMFAVATANCPFGQSVETIRRLKEWGDDISTLEYADVTQEMKSGMGCGLTAAKLAAYKYLWAHRESIYAKFLECNAIPNGHLIFWEYCMDCLMGMGMVKAAFATQMLFNKLGCIDIHNARELGYDKCPTGKAKKNRPVYLEIQDVKTSEQWWDDWCIALAKKYPTQFESGDHVSKLHLIAVVG